MWCSSQQAITRRSRAELRLPYSVRPRVKAEELMKLARLDRYSFASIFAMVILR
jgi:hypothetical protein